MRRFSQSIFAWFTMVWGGFLFGLSLSSVPIVSAQALIPSAVQTVDIVSDAVANIALPNGFLISGAVTLPQGEPVGIGTVTARSSTERYTGQLVTQNAAAAYRIAVPADRYDLSLMMAFLDTDSEPPALVYTASAATTGLSITTDITQNLAVTPLPPLTTVSGLVTALDHAPVSGALQFVSLDGSTFTIARFENDYLARLPLGTYAVSAELIFSENAASPRAAASVAVNLDPVNVTGETFHDVALPATAQLSGIVSDALGGPIAPARVVASGASQPVPADIDFSCGSSIAFSPESVAVSGTAMIHRLTLQGEPNPTGDYRMPLPVGTYHLGVTVGLELQPGIAPALVSLDRSPSGILHVQGDGPGLGLTADTTQNLMVPDLPPVVTLAGQVTAPQGQLVANAVVKVVTSTLINVSNATFFATAQTRDDGTYILPVLSGTGYQVMACPPDAN